MTSSASIYQNTIKSPNLSIVKESLSVSSAFFLFIYSLCWARKQPRRHQNLDNYKRRVTRAQWNNYSASHSIWPIYSARKSSALTVQILRQLYAQNVFAFFAQLINREIPLNCTSRRAHTRRGGVRASEFFEAHHRVNLTPICVAIIAFEPAAHQAPTFTAQRKTRSSACKEESTLVSQLIPFTRNAQAEEISVHEEE